MIEALAHFLLFVFVLFFLPLFIYIRRCIRFYRLQRYIIYKPFIDIRINSEDKTIEHEEIKYRTADGRNIHAWFVPYKPGVPVSLNVENIPDESVADESESSIEREKESEKLTVPDTPIKSKGVILFCHGNAGNISQRIDTFKIFSRLGFSTFIFDYRGFGNSIGVPTEKGTYLDADGAWNYLINTRNVKPEEIIIFGRSLGGAIAAYLAQKYQPRALVIESSFTSALDMAVSMYNWLPVKLLTRFKYNTLERLKDINCPVLIIHSPDDLTIPYNHSQTLFETANPPKKFLRIKGDHLEGFLKSKTVYMQGLRDFFTELPEPFISAHVIGNDN